MTDLTPDEFSGVLATILPILAQKGITHPTDALLVPLIKAHLPEEKRAGVDALVAQGAITWPAQVRQMEKRQ